MATNSALGGRNPVLLALTMNPTARGSAHHPARAVLPLEPFTAGQGRRRRPGRPAPVIDLLLRRALPSYAGAQPPSAPPPAQAHRGRIPHPPIDVVWRSLARALVYVVHLLLVTVTQTLWLLLHPHVRLGLSVTPLDRLHSDRHHIYDQLVHRGAVCGAAIFFMYCYMQLVSYRSHRAHTENKIAREMASRQRAREYAWGSDAKKPSAREYLETKGGQAATEMKRRGTEMKRRGARAWTTGVNYWKQKSREEMAKDLLENQFIGARLYKWGFLITSLFVFGAVFGNWDGFQRSQGIGFGLGIAFLILGAIWRWYGDQYYRSRRRQKDENLASEIRNRHAKQHRDDLKALKNTREAREQARQARRTGQAFMALNDDGDSEEETAGIRPLFAGDDDYEGEVSPPMRHMLFGGPSDKLYQRVLSTDEAAKLDSSGWQRASSRRR